MCEVICNNCVGGEIYKALNLPYDNPFIWCDIDVKTFAQIVQCFNCIDFSNVKQIYATKSPLYAEWKKCGQDVSSKLCILLDEKYVMLFPHHAATNKDFEHISARFKRYQKVRPIFVLHATATMCKADIEQHLAINDYCYAISQYDLTHARHIKQPSSANTVPAIAKYALENGLKSIC